MQELSYLVSSLGNIFLFPKPHSRLRQDHHHLCHLFLLIWSIASRPAKSSVELEPPDTSTLHYANWCCWGWPLNGLIGWYTSLNAWFLISVNVRSSQARFLMGQLSVQYISSSPPRTINEINFHRYLIMWLTIPWWWDDDNSQFPLWSG